MKKIFKILAWFVSLGALVLIVLYIAFNEKQPEGVPGPEAEALAQRVFEAVNKTAWDSTDWVKWSYRGGHRLVWDKKNGNAAVEWDGKKALLYSADPTRNKAYRKGVLLQGEAAEKVLHEGWKWFFNDTYWLCAPMKIMDEGTTRSIVTLENGKKGLKVQYSSGGMTPGDAYVWELDDNGLPTRYRMWVKVLPLGGTSGTWERWTTLPTGAKVATLHVVGGLLKLDISDLEAGRGDIALE